MSEEKPSLNLALKRSAEALRNENPTIGVVTKEKLARFQMTMAKAEVIEKARRLRIDPSDIAVLSSSFLIPSLKLKEKKVDKQKGK